MTEEEMEGSISYWGYKEQETHLILPEHDDDDDDDEEEEEEEEEETKGCCIWSSVLWNDVHRRYV